MIFHIESELTLTKLNSGTARAIKRMLTLENPKFKDAEKMGRYTGDIPEHLGFYEQTPTMLKVPRGAAGLIYQICVDRGETVEIVNRKRSHTPVGFIFHGSLRPLQTRAVNDVKMREFGILEAGTGAGKTVMALALIADRNQPALVVVHTKELLNQWVDRIGQFLKIPADDIGIIGKGKLSLGKKVTVATVQTLHKVVGEVVPYIGHLIIDEAHRTPARTFTDVVTAFDCQYMLGLTATPYRRDGLTSALHWTIGPVTARIEKKDLVEAGHLCKAQVVFHETKFTPSVDVSDYYSTALSEMTADSDRNRFICDTIADNARGITLVLTDRKAHCKAIQEGLNGLDAEVLTGSTTSTERLRIVDDLRQNRCKCLIATGSLIGEGFDLAGIQSVFLTTPVKFSGRLIQYIGRALRPAPGKPHAVIHDFVDHLNPVFLHSAKTRKNTYLAQGIAA